MPYADSQQFGCQARIAGHVAADAERFATGKFHGISEQAQDSLKLHEFKEAQNVAVIFGNEVTGVEQSTIQLCDGTIEIPQHGMKHSLNIATAAGIVLWELFKQIMEKKQA